MQKTKTFCHELNWWNYHIDKILSITIVTFLKEYLFGVAYKNLLDIVEIIFHACAWINWKNAKLYGLEGSLDTHCNFSSPKQFLLVKKSVWNQNRERLIDS